MITFFAVSAALLCALAFVYWRWSKRVNDEIREGAEHAFAALQQNDPAIVAGYDAARFAAIYRRVHFPRFPKYALACVAAFILSFPLALGALSGAAIIAERAGLTAAPAELARYVPIDGWRTSATAAEREEMALLLAQNFSGFYYFFGIIGAWLAIVAVFMRRYHLRRPGYLRDELIRQRDAQPPGKTNEGT